MASNHTAATLITDQIAAKFFWENGYSSKFSSMSKKDFLKMAEYGDIQISSVMENFISLHNKKIKRSNDDGMDHTDGSECKYMSTRIKTIKSKHTLKDGTVKVYETKMLNCALSPKSLKNKKGTLRIAITVYNPITEIGNVLLVKIPYPEWANCTVANGYLVFDFNLDGTFKPIQEKRFGKWICHTVKDFCK
jgi:hypothetical protein